MRMFRSSGMNKELRFPKRGWLATFLGLFCFAMYQGVGYGSMPGCAGAVSLAFASGLLVEMLLAKACRFSLRGVFGVTLVVFGVLMAISAFAVPQVALSKVGLWGFSNSAVVIVALDALTRKVSLATRTSVVLLGLGFVFALGYYWTFFGKFSPDS